MAIIKNELSVAQGFGTLQKVFTMAANEAITYGMVCSLSGGELVKGYSGTGMAYVAQNSYTSDDAIDGSDVKIVCIPVTCACEVEIPAALFEAEPSVGAELIASDAGDVGLWVTNPATSTATVIGTVTEETSDGFLVLLEKTPRFVAA